MSDRVGRVRYRGEAMCRLAVLTCCVVLAACGDERPRPTGEGDLSYPRLATYQLGGPLDADRAALLERVSLAIVDAEVGAVDPASLEAAVAKHPRLVLVAHLAIDRVPFAADPQQPLASARFDAVPAGAWVLESGSTTVGPTSASSTRIRVADPGAFSVTRPASPHVPADEPTYLLVGGEHVRLLAIEADELVVERAVRSTAATHAAGAPIAAHVVARAGTWMVDLADSAWREQLANEAVSLVTSGTWSGLALDGCVPAAGAPASWDTAAGELVTTLRERLGTDVPLVARATEQECAQDALDGLVFEGFPVGISPEQLDFDTGFERYVRWTSRADHPPLSIANAYAASESAVVAMRFGLAVALMGDGYYTFDNGDRHDVAWWYDELDGAGRGRGWLGHPQGPPTRIGGGAYVRTFTKGMAIANPTSVPVNVTVPPGFVRLDGTAVDGPLVVSPRDGTLLSR